MRYRRNQRKSRRAAMLVLAALLMILMVGMIAFAMDIGYIVLVRSQLQTAADSAAMAAASVMGGEPGMAFQTARQYAAYHTAAGENVRLAEDDVELGIWDTETRSFVPLVQAGNAVRVTARRDTASGGETPLFFARIFGHENFSMSASAVATANPRDIVFVVDLSGSMNDDTEPAWATGEVDKMFGPLGYAGIGKALMQDVFDDFGFGTFPGVAVYVGEPLGVPQGQYAYAELTKDGGPLAQATIPATYRIASSDTELTRKRKAYRWMIDYQIAAVMPNALPKADSSTNYAYWERYLDYIMWPVTIMDTLNTGGGGGSRSGGGTSSGGSTLSPTTSPLLPSVPLPPLGQAPPHRQRGERERWLAGAPRTFLISNDGSGGAGLLAQRTVDRLDPAPEPQLAFLYPPSGGSLGTPPSNRGALPPSQSSDRIVRFNNPNTSTYAGASASVPASYRNWIGYLTYTQFMMDHGRDLQPLGGQYVPLSRNSPYCPYHSEATAGGTFSFPPREQPMHACRRSLIAALQVMKDRNGGLANMNQRDWAGVVSFDSIQNGAGAVLRVPLTGDYDAAMLACTRLQPVGDKGSSTATDTGLNLALQVLSPRSRGGNARESTTKDVILLTDGVPNATAALPLDVFQFVQNVVDATNAAEFYNTGATWLDAALMSTANLKAGKVNVFPVGVGGGTDYDFMDRVARIGGTADAAGQSPRGSGNPADYELRLQQIFDQIISKPQVRLVQ